MEKPNHISHLESILKVIISEYSIAENVENYDNRNTYTINGKGEIIGLNLIGNRINDISFLKNFTSLTELNLAHNLISDISAIKDLGLLERLDLNNNNISDLSPLKTLVNLKSLIIWQNKISDITMLKHLKKISFLDVSYNLISDISVLSNLKELSILILWQNNLNDITVLRNLIKLEILNLGENHLTDISCLIDLKYLKEINLENNQISDITTLLKIDSLKNVILTGNKKIEIDFPSEVLNADWQAVKFYSENSKKNIPFKNVKILLLGNPNIGKSNLLEYLETNQIPQRNELTHGVVYKKIAINDINFHIWDFGGQEYFHATHKLFFSPNALNIILWGKHEARIHEELKNHNFNLDYWLRTIEQLTKIDKPQEVLVIENKTDLNNPKYSATPQNQIKYVENYNSLNISFLDFCLIELKKTENFKDRLIELSGKIISNFNYPAFFEVFWKRIENLDKDFVTIEEINNRPRIENTISAVKIFHNMGMLLYFPDIIANKVFVKPQILLELLYEKVLGQSKKDRLSKIEIQNAISGNSLQLSVEEIISLLKYFDLCFEIDEEKNTYFIPQFLKEQNPFVTVFEKNTFEFCNIKVKADHYLMSLAMLKVFTKYGNNVKSKENKEYLFWNNGIIIEKGNQILMIKFDRENQTIQLYQSKNNTNFNLQREIVDFILNIPHVGVMTIKSNYSKNFVWDINWKSTYFKVLISIDGEYFVPWRKLESDQELTQIKTHKKSTLDEGIEEKIEETTKFKKFLIGNIPENIKINMSENQKPVINNINNYHGSVTNYGTISNNTEHAITNNNAEPTTMPSGKLGFSEKERKAVKSWKNKALYLFILSLIITIASILIYFLEFTFIMSKQDWTEFKKDKFVGLLINISPLGWTTWTLKMAYDRFCDSSKENSFIDLHRKKN